MGTIKIKAILLGCLLVLWGCESGTPPVLGGPAAGSSSGATPLSQQAGLDPALESQLTPLAEIASAFARQEAAMQVLVRGQVTRLLSDDTSGDQHQRFIVELEDGRTLLVAHNIDLAPRAPVQVGSTVYLYGEYAYNAEGGVVHWTHIDPDGSHVAGWIQFEGARYR